MDKTEGILIATSYRGDYVLKQGWIYHNADESKGYANCIFGDFEYFVNRLKINKDYKLTKKGEEILRIFNNCKKGIHCDYCQQNQLSKCEIYK
jgi:hypothetical protein